MTVILLSLVGMVGNTCSTDSFVSVCWLVLISFPFIKVTAWSLAIVLRDTLRFGFFCYIICYIIVHMWNACNAPRQLPYVHAAVDFNQVSFQHPCSTQLKQKKQKKQQP